MVVGKRLACAVFAYTSGLIWIVFCVKKMLNNGA